MIKIAKKEDLPEIVAIYNASIPHRIATADTQAVSLESRIPWFDGHHNQRPLWVYEKNGDIAGWVSLQDFYGRPAYQATVEISVYVKSNFKRQGVAKHLISHAIAACPNLGVNTILGFIFGHNEPSINLFLGFGFTQWGYLPKVARLDDSEKDLAIYGLKI